MTSLIEAAATGGLTFARFFPSDWRTGCLTLNLEEEGLYIRVCMFHYDTGKALPDDYSKCSQLLRVHPNKLKKVMDSLIEKGKIIRAQGILFNERVQEEIDKFRSEHLARAIAARKREEAKKARLAEMLRELEEAQARRAATPQTTPQTTQGYTPHITPPDHPQVGHGVGAKKINEINETGARGKVHQNLEARNQKPEEERKGGRERVAERVSPHEDLGFDGERISFDHDEVAEYAANFPELEFPRDLRIVEKATHYRVSEVASRMEFVEELQKALELKAMDFRTLREKATRVAESKEELKASQSCFIQNGRVMVANGFKAELLAEYASGDETALRDALDRAGQYVPARAKGEALMLAVRTQLAKQKTWAVSDGAKGKKNAAPDAVSNMMDLARAVVSNSGGRA
jgi:uncharacterized protein YdaU (DUF1376 family)